MSRIVFTNYLATFVPTAETPDAGVVPIVIMEDEPVHTAENGYRCDGDPTCPCHEDEQEEVK